MSALTHVLRWAAGADELPTDQDFDDQELLALIGQHALAGRLVRRLPAGPLWLRRRIGVPAAQLYSDTLDRAARHVRAIGGIVAELGGRAAPVLVKGIATGLLTGDEHLLRCGDIDLACADGEVLIAALNRLGYIRTREPFLHELGEFTRDGVEIDVHGYLPVPGYGTVRHTDLEVSAPGRAWCRSGHTTSLSRIGYERLAERATVTESGVLVSDPCLLAIVLCAHAFLNFTNMWSLSHRAKPYVKLAELADLQALARHDAFDPDRFAALVDDLDAGNAVRWAGWASTVTLGTNPLPVPAGTEPFPRCLWWDFWVNLPVDVEALLLPDWYPLSAITALLGDRKELDTNCPGPWTVDVRRSGGGVTVTVGLPEHSGATTERGRVDFGTTGTEWALTGGRLQAVGSHHTCELLPGRRIRLRFHHSSTAGRVLVGVAEQDATGKLLTAVLLPVVMEPAQPVGHR